MLQSGVDCFHGEPGSTEIRHCLVCGTACVAKGDSVGPTSHVEAMAGGKHSHSFAVCPNAEEAWHLQIRALREEQGNTQSASIKKILADEMDHIFDTKKTTAGWKPTYRDM